MSGSLIIALYAAIVATAGVTWQIFLWRADHAGRLAVTLSAWWSLLEDQEISIKIINQNPYDVQIAHASVVVSGENGSSSRPIFIESLGLTNIVPARSTIGWQMGGPPLLPSLFQMSKIRVTIVTGVGRREFASSEIHNLDLSSRDASRRALGALTNLRWGDQVRIRIAAGHNKEYDNRVGTIRGYGLAYADTTLQVMFDDHSSVNVPISNVELITTYNERLGAYRE